MSKFSDSIALIDSHVHVGKFFNRYNSPIMISSLMRCLGVTKYVVSSTTICNEDYPRVIEEFHQLMSLDADRVLPVMWITPEGLKGNIAWFLDSDIKWKCLKIHPELHPYGWFEGTFLIQEVIDIAREMSLPLLIHTGEKESSQCCKFEEIIANNQDVPIILAHGRPIKDAIRIAKDYDNAFIDSAFMPVEDMKKIIECGLSDKLLWGTDMCIPKYFFPETNMKRYYIHKLNAFKGYCSFEQFKEVTHINAAKLFKIDT